MINPESNHRDDGDPHKKCKCTTPSHTGKHIPNDIVRILSCDWSILELDSVSSVDRDTCNM